MAVYISVEKYLECATSIQDKIARLDVIILALMTAMEKAALTGQFEEYRIDDGQVKIETIYRDINALSKSLDFLELQRERYLNKLFTRNNGRITRLVDGRNFI
jgi:hypothetical protein